MRPPKQEAGLGRSGSLSDSSLLEAAQGNLGGALFRKKGRLATNAVGGTLDGE